MPGARCARGWRPHSSGECDRPAETAYGTREQEYFQVQALLLTLTINSLSLRAACKNVQGFRVAAHLGVANHRQDAVVAGVGLGKPVCKHLTANARRQGCRQRRWSGWDAAAAGFVGCGSAVVQWAAAPGACRLNEPRSSTSAPEVTATRRASPSRRLYRSSGSVRTVDCWRDATSTALRSRRRSPHTRRTWPTSGNAAAIRKLRSCLARLWPGCAVPSSRNWWGRRCPNADGGGSTRRRARGRSTCSVIVDPTNTRPSFQGRRPL